MLKDIDTMVGTVLAKVVGKGLAEREEVTGDGTDGLVRTWGKLIVAGVCAISVVDQRFV